MSYEDHTPNTLDFTKIHSGQTDHFKTHSNKQELNTDIIDLSDLKDSTSIQTK